MQSKVKKDYLGKISTVASPIYHFTSSQRLYLSSEIILKAVTMNLGFEPGPFEWRAVVYPHPPINTLLIGLVYVVQYLTISNCLKKNPDSTALR